MSLYVDFPLEGRAKKRNRISAAASDPGPAASAYNGIVNSILDSKRSRAESEQKHSPPKISADESSKKATDSFGAGHGSRSKIYIQNSSKVSRGRKTPSALGDSHNTSLTYLSTSSAASSERSGGYFIDVPARQRRPCTVESARGIIETNANTKSEHNMCERNDSINSDNLDEEMDMSFLESSAWVTDIHVPGGDECESETGKHSACIDEKSVLELEDDWNRVLVNGYAMSPNLNSKKSAVKEEKKRAHVSSRRLGIRMHSRSNMKQPPLRRMPSVKSSDAIVSSILEQRRTRLQKPGMYQSGEQVILKGMTFSIPAIIDEEDNGQQVCQEESVDEKSESLDRQQHGTEDTTEQIFETAEAKDTAKQYLRDSEEAVDKARADIITSARKEDVERRGVSVDEMQTEQNDRRAKNALPFEKEMQVSSFQAETDPPCMSFDSQSLIRAMRCLFCYPFTLRSNREKADLQSRLPFVKNHLPPRKSNPQVKQEKACDTTPMLVKDVDGSLVLEPPDWFAHNLPRDNDFDFDVISLDVLLARDAQKASWI